MLWVRGGKEAFELAFALLRFLTTDPHGRNVGEKRNRVWFVKRKEKKNR